MIEIRSLTKNFGSHAVLRGVTMQVRQGEVAVLIGGSGGGKSTLLRCMNGLETFDGGTIQVDGLALLPGKQKGEDAHTLRRLRARVGMVFQQFNLFPHMTVLENVMCGPLHVQRTQRDEAESKARKHLDRVGLIDKLHERPATLSGGQQQRVAIARALANDPIAMLFDEPTSALDPRMTAEVLAVMADLAAEGQTMVVVSHAMGFVRKSAHRIHVLAGGQIVESGPPAQIFESAMHESTQEFLRDAMV